MNTNLPKIWLYPSIVVSIVRLYEYLVKYTDLKFPNLTAHFSPFVQGSLFLTIGILLITVIAFLITSLFLYQKFINRQKYFKYCYKCDLGINSKSPESYCNCGTKYIVECPKCNNRIIRDYGHVCSFCGHNFPKSKRSWMAS